MKRYLVDANLPYFFSIWNAPEYIHVFNLNEAWSDEEIWNYAQLHDLTIISKDSDFSHRIIISEPPPRVIHIRLGNMRLKELYQRLLPAWVIACDLSKTHKLVNIFADHIEAIS